ncbi:MAG: NAD(P)H-binding protein [Chitinophagaceae bacterium]
MQAQTAVVIGATGLIGEQLVQELLQDATFGKIVLLVRRPIPLSHPKLEIRIVDFNDLNDLSAKLGEGDAVFCCVGTTRSKVKGNKEAYRKVDYDIPVNTARRAVQQGFTEFLVVSAVGASTASGSFYLQLKGSMEEDVRGIPFRSVHIFRPSLLLGKRKEFRLGERIAQVIFPAISFLLPGGLSKYKAISDTTVAKAILAAARQAKQGIHEYEYNEIQQLAKASH